MSFHSERSELKIQFTLWNKLQQDFEKEEITTVTLIATQTLHKGH